ncbi:MAG: hypothetical protein H6740_04370 [Alphaproteobacteria bacterium]|nr:hypothetical protein [Alphaproteobacteria bacterium]
MLLSLPLLLGVAHAQDFVRDISDEIVINVGGGWNRTFPAEDGWHFLWSAGGDYNWSPMPQDFNWADTERKLLTGRSNLQDHGVSECPDGSWLHAASATLNEPDDSAYAWIYDGDFNQAASLVIAEGDDGLKHNDILVACTPNFRLIGFTNRQLAGGTAFVYDSSLNLIQSKELENAPTLSGTSAIHDPDTGGILLAGFELASQDESLKITRYDANLDYVDQHSIDVAPGSARCYWAQGFMRLGDYYAVAHMCRDESAGWEGDTGDVWLDIFDADWNLLEQHNVTNNTLPQGGMRPYLTRKGAQLLMSYDEAVRPRMHVIELNLAAFGLAEGEDSGLPWNGDDSGVPVNDSGLGGGKGCGGCASGAPRGGGALAALWLGLALRRRRAPRSATP